LDEILSHQHDPQLHERNEEVISHLAQDFSNLVPLVSIKKEYKLKGALSNQILADSLKGLDKIGLDMDTILKEGKQHVDKTNDS